MKILKSLIVILFLYLVLSSTESKAQEFDVLTFTDTTASFTIPSGTRQVFLTVVDSAIAGVDTVICQAPTYNTTMGTTFWSWLSAQDLAKTSVATYVDRMIPGTSTTSPTARTYVFNTSEMVSGTFRVVRLNTGTDNAYQPKTRLIVNYR